MSFRLRLIGLSTSALLGLCQLAIAADGPVVVVDGKSPASKLSPEQVNAILLMRVKNLPGAGNAQLVVVAARKSSLLSVMGKSDDQARAIWARQVFSGGGSPPLEVGSVAEAKKLLQSNPNALVLIDANDVDDSMKVICNY